ncbi:scpA Rec8/ScpA/Scc1-like protein (kleisin family) [Rhabdaerophilaceae bacterium]
MTKRHALDQDFDDSMLGPADARDEQGQLTLSLDGYEGPLDLLLDLARKDKLDLREISILSLADQYLAYIQEAHQLKLEVAGDYLVMAAWLTFLKSRLMLPKFVETEEAADAAELANALAERLLKLERIRKLGAMLAVRFADTQLGMPRGGSEATIVERSNRWLVSLHDLISAYANVRQVAETSHYQIAHRVTIPIPEARAHIEMALGQAVDWTSLSALIAAMPGTRRAPRSANASAFAAALELVRDRRAEVRQEGVFAPVFLRSSAGFSPASPEERP